jgi:CheY-like chemotaxis protein
MMAMILCIDDEPVLLKIYATLLESSGYKVLTAPDGPSGIALTRIHPVDAVLSDFYMPGMDGDQVAQVLKVERPALPVLIWSGCPEEIPASRRPYGNLLLNKADGPEALLAAIGRVLRESITPSTSSAG